MLKCFPFSICINLLIVLLSVKLFAVDLRCSKSLEGRSVQHVLDTEGVPAYFGDALNPVDFLLKHNIVFAPYKDQFQLKEFYQRAVRVAGASPGADTEQKLKPTGLFVDKTGDLDISYLEQLAAKSSTKFGYNENTKLEVKRSFYDRAKRIETSRLYEESDKYIFHRKLQLDQYSTRIWNFYYILDKTSVSELSKDKYIDAELLITEKGKIDSREYGIGGRLKVAVKLID